MLEPKTVISAEDLLATSAVAVGIGLLALMITWLVTNRIAGVFWGPPADAVLSMGLAVTCGFVSGFIGFRRLMTRSG